MKDMIIFISLLRPFESPHEALFLISVIIKGKVHTEGMLKRRNSDRPSRCSICCEEKELVDELSHC